MLETHNEKNLVINNRELHYEGRFLLQELFFVINQALTERGYEKREKKTEEKVAEAGRNILIELRPFKQKTNYVTLMIKIRIFIHDMTEQVESFREAKHKFQHGKIEMLFDAWSLTNYESRWGMKPFVYFLKGVINKYLYTFPQESGFVGELVGDTAYVYGQMKRWLNSYKEPGFVLPKEEEVRKKVKEEMEKETSGKG